MKRAAKCKTICDVTYYYIENDFVKKSNENYKKLVTNEDYKLSKSCKWCKDTFNSFGKFVAVYCGKKKDTIFYGDENDLSGCRKCEFYEGRKNNGDIEF